MSSPSPLENILHQRISLSGPLSFADFMGIALYHPEHGYYTKGPERSGWGGHFITSPQLDPAFGQLWSAAFRQIWDAAGRPSRFDIIEAGPGEGGFASSVLRSIQGSPFGEAVHLTLIERSPHLRQRQHERVGGDRVRWYQDLTAVPKIGCGCFFANEVLDNQPVHLLESRDGEPVEMYVTSSDETLVLEARPPSAAVLDYLARNPIQVQPGHRLEISPAAENLVTTAAGKVAEGALFFVDYGDEVTQLAAGREGSLVCYSGGGTDTQPLEKPGEKDITAFADWTMVRGALERAGCVTQGPIPQAQVLRKLGSASVDEQLRADHGAALETGRGGDALRALSRRQALGALLDPGGLGRLGVVAGLKGVMGSLPLA